MDKNLIFIKLSKKKRSDLYHKFIIGIIFMQSIMTSIADTHKEYYRADNFGYIIINNNDHSVGIYKYITNEKGALNNIANCKIVKYQDNYFTITSQQPYKSDQLLLGITTKEETNPDSISISIVIPRNLSERYYISVEPVTEKIKNIQFSNDGKATFKLKKHAFDLYNQFTLCVYPKVNPFYNYSSWGDNQTLSFLDLQIEKHIDLDFYNMHLSEAKISILNFSDDIFQKWVIIEDIVIIRKDQLLWRNFVFTKINQTSIDVQF
ncbi:MAG: hypothetical protein NC548_58480 [Lachnospiraceae bacterium]|nr:hypothetical protein [Lachnospiraceae bacterium]